MRKVGIIVAMDSEYKLVQNSLSNSIIDSTTGFCKGQLGNSTAILCKAGIGKVNAAVTTYALINQEHPDYIINTGVAGSLDEKIEPMNVVIGTKVKYHDVWCGKPNERGQIQGEPEWFPCIDVKQKAKGLSKVQRKHSNKKYFFSVFFAPIVSGDWFMETGANRLRALHACGRAKAVDMESGAIAQVCNRFEVPFVPIRIISDFVGDPKHKKKYDNFWENLAERSFDLCMQLIKDINGKY